MMGIHRQGRKGVDILQNCTARIHVIHRQMARLSGIIMQGILIFIPQLSQIVHLGTVLYRGNQAFLPLSGILSCLGSILQGSVGYPFHMVAVCLRRIIVFFTVGKVFPGHKFTRSTQLSTRDSRFSGSVSLSS